MAYSVEILRVSTMDELDTVCSNCGTPVSSAAAVQAESVRKDRPRGVGFRRIPAIP